MKSKHSHLNNDTLEDRGNDFSSGTFNLSDKIEEIIEELAGDKLT